MLLRGCSQEVRSPRSEGLRTWGGGGFGFGFGVWGLGFGVWGLGFGVLGFWGFGV